MWYRNNLLVLGSDLACSLCSKRRWHYVHVGSCRQLIIISMSHYFHGTVSGDLSHSTPDVSVYWVIFWHSTHLTSTLHTVYSGPRSVLNTLATLNPWLTDWLIESLEVYIIPKNEWKKWQHWQNGKQHLLNTKKNTQSMTKLNQLCTYISVCVCVWTSHLPSSPALCVPSECAVSPSFRPPLSASVPHHPSAAEAVQTRVKTLQFPSISIGRMIRYDDRPWNARCAFSVHSLRRYQLILLGDRATCERLVQGRTRQRSGWDWTRSLQPYV